MYKAIIIDNDEDRVSLINKVLTDFYPQIEVIKVLRSTANAFLVINDLNPDLIIINGSYPNKAAFKLLEKISNYYFHCILFDCTNEYEKNKDFEIVDYLINPIVEIEIKKVLHKLILKMTDKYIRNQKELLLLSSRNYQYAKKEKNCYINFRRPCFY